VSTHTPGPWTMSSPMGAGRDEGREPWFWVSADRTLHLQVAPCPDGYVAGENEANARLIAAAPELLEALRTALDASWNGPMPDYARDQARAAIKKAEEDKT